jgi:hypothetical protein
MDLISSIATLALLSTGVTPQDEAPEPARYVRIELTGLGKVLSLAEVEVFVGGESIAIGKRVKQSSQYGDAGPECVVDGITAGDYTLGQASHTEFERDPWWEVDLGDAYPIERIVVWNRTDCCEERLQAFTIKLFDKRHKILWEGRRNPMPSPAQVVIPFVEPVAGPTGPTPEERGALQPGIDSAIDAGIQYLLSRQLWDGSFDAHSAEYVSGSTALAVYTLIKSRVPKDHPGIQRGVNYIVAHPPTQTYEYGTVLMALGALGGDQYIEYMEELLAELIDLQGAQGGDGKRDELWAYPAISHLADLSIAQYAALGLRAAQNAGLKVPSSVWIGAARSVLRYQEEPFRIEDVLTEKGGTTGTTRIAGFPYRVGGESKGSLTTAGLSILSICREGLEVSGGFPINLRRKIDTSVKMGTGWLAYNFSVTTNVGGDPKWLNYYLYGLERVGALQGVDNIGMHNWYWEGAKELVKKQGDDGSWAPDSDCDTCFALLFLSRATASTTTGDNKAVGPPEGVWASEGEELDVSWRITGGSEAVLFLDSFSDLILENFAVGEASMRGVRVVRVEYLVDGEVIETKKGDQARKWTGERFAARYRFKTAGVHRCEIRVTIQAPDEFVDGDSTEVLLGQPLDVEVEEIPDVALQEYGRHSRDNLLQNTTVQAIGSSENNGNQTASKAVDGRFGTSWVCANTDSNPQLTLELNRPQKGRVLLLSQLNMAEWARDFQDRATRIRIVINGKKKYTYEVQAPPGDQSKAILELPRAMSLKRLEITVLERTKGKEYPGQVGFSEIQWLESL